MDRTSIDRAAALLSYPIAYIYFYWFMTNFYTFDHPRLFTQWGGHFLFSVLFVLAVEVYARAVNEVNVTRHPKHAVNVTRHQYLNESSGLAALLLLQSLALLIHGPHEDGLAVAQVLFWHFTCIYYVCARTGILTTGRTGKYFIWDALNGVVFMPLRHIFLRLVCLLRRKKEKKAETVATASTITESDTQSATAAAAAIDLGATVHESMEAKNRAPEDSFKKAAIFGFTLFFAGTVCAIAWNELAGASDSFGRLGQGAMDFLAKILSIESFFDFLEEYLPYVIFSIPIGAYLFGLVGGGLSDKYAASRATREEKLQEGLRRFRILPAYSAYVVLGCLLAVYVLFFGVQISELIGALTVKSGAPLRELISVQDACEYAVNGFWQLVRVILLNFAVLLGFTLLSKKPIWEEKRSLLLIDLIFICAAAFALLAGYKLFVLYFYQYGPTPRRILSGWMVVMQLLWCILTLIRFHRRFPAVKIGVYAGAISFTALMLLDIDGICGMV